MCPAGREGTIICKCLTRVLSFVDFKALENIYIIKSSMFLFQPVPASDVGKPEEVHFWDSNLKLGQGNIGFIFSLFVKIPFREKKTVIIFVFKS